MHLTAFRRREQTIQVWQSMIILLLLLLATLCVDAVAAYWWLNANESETAFALFFGLMFGNLSVLCVWATHCRRARWLTWLAPFVTGFLIALPSGSLIDTGGFISKSTLVLAFTGLFWIYVAALLVLLWLLNQTRFARPVGQMSAASPWQVSVMQLLIVTTVAAVILTVWTNSKLLQSGSDVSWIPWAVNNLVVALTVVVFFSRPWSLIARTAAVAAAALGFGMIFLIVLQLMDQSLGSTGFPFWQNLFHASILLIWLQLGGISSRAAPDSSDEVSRQ